jgi:hypothetical protein
MLEGSIGHYLLSNILIEINEPLVWHIFNTHNQLLLVISLRFQPQLYKPAPILHRIQSGD